ncbi:MAG TPA: TonB family protein [Steroidobacteraceae bacterium]
MASSSLLHDFQGNAALAATAPDSAPAGEGVVVLTRDEALIRTLRSIGSEYNIFTAGTESELASHLLGDNAGVAILDASAVATPVDRISERLRAQFPELVLIVAGSVDDQSALATQITNGTVYRFLHKPVSEQRVKLFVDAAWRRRSEQRGSTAPVATGATPSHKGAGKTGLLLTGIAAVAIAALAGWLWLHKTRSRQAQAVAVSTAEPTQAEAVRDDVLEDLLARAQTALASDALVAPPGANAADLYRKAQQHNPKDPRAANGLEKVIDRLLSSAEAQLLAQHLEEAQRLTDLARAIKPEHVRVAFLLAQIGKERERAVLAQARQAASSGNIEQALSVLDSATHDGQHSPLVREARQELQHKELDARVRDYVHRANDRMRDGALLQPAENNAQFYIESARALAPNDAEVKQTQRQFLERLVSEARRALTAGNVEQSEQWTQAAAAAGVAEDEIAALRQEAQKVRATAKTDALARLALLVSQRLSQGKVLDPSDDSAKSYLAQLEQADPTFPSTQAARQAFAARALDEAKKAVRREDYTHAQRWLTEAHEAGIDQASINAVNTEIRTAQEAAKRAAEPVPATQLELTHYVAPEFPFSARTRAVSGWVDVQFIVKTDGSVADIAVIRAEPAGLFEESATEAVHKWRYRPILRDGQPINQRARVRVRFALQQ